MTDLRTVSIANRTDDSSIPDQDTTIKKINDATSWLFILEAHMALLKAKIAKEKESKKKNQSGPLDCTIVSQTYSKCLQNLWTSGQNYKIKVLNEKNKLFNLLTSEVMGPPLPNPDVEHFRREILEIGNLLTPFIIIKNELTEEKVMLEQEMMENKREMLKLIADVGDKMEQTESQIHPREIQKRNQRLMKIKICRSMINSLIVRSTIDFEEHPELVDMKIKWRRPVSSMLRTR